jgi:hypothetical protein
MYINTGKWPHYNENDARKKYNDAVKRTRIDAEKTRIKHRYGRIRRKQLREEMQEKLDKVNNQIVGYKEAIISMEQHKHSVMGNWIMRNYESQLNNLYDRHQQISNNYSTI